MEYEDFHHRKEPTGKEAVVLKFQHFFQQSVTTLNNLKILPGIKDNPTILDEINMCIDDFEALLAQDFEMKAELNIIQQQQDFSAIYNSILAHGITRTVNRHKMMAMNGVFSLN